MRSLVSIGAALLASILCLALFGWGISQTEFAADMIRLDIGLASPSEIAQSWSNGYLIQWLVVLVVPFVHGAVVAAVQRKVAPSSRPFLSFAVATPGATVLLLVNLLAITNGAAFASTTLGFLGILVGVRYGNGSH